MKSSTSKQTTSLMKLLIFSVLGCATMLCGSAQILEGADSWGGFTDASVRLNTTRYSFGPNRPDAFETNQNYYDGDFADYDNDGLIDRGLGSRYGLLRNTGGGVFLPWAAQVGFQARGLNGESGLGDDGWNWADIDNDGDFDCFSGGNGEPFLCRENLGGTFREKFRMGGQVSALNIVNTDINGDGFVDLSVSHAFCAEANCGGPLTYALLVNDGTGKMTEQSALRGLPYNGGGHTITGCVSADFDGDGDFDLFLSHGFENDPTKHYYILARNNGSGFFSSEIVPGKPMGSGFDQGMTLGDIDDDGDMDVICCLGRWNSGSNPQDMYQVFVNNGSGRFTQDAGSRIRLNGHLVLPDTGMVGKLVDIDYDDDLDLVVAESLDPSPYTRMITIFRNNGAGYFDHDAAHAITSPSIGHALGIDLDITDIDGDGVYDAWFGAGGNDVAILLNTFHTVSGARADTPLALRAVASSSAAGTVTIGWKAPAFASAQRAFKVYRQVGSAPTRANGQVIAYVGTRNQDEAFANGISNHTTTAMLRQTNVQIDPSTHEIQFTDRNAPAGFTYYYAVTHIGAENTESSLSAPISVSGSGTVNQAPVSRISAVPASGTAPLTVSFNGTASSDSDGSIVAYVWNFGDGNSGSGSTVSHLYAAGSYVATLTVTDNANATASSTMSITATAGSLTPSIVTQPASMSVTAGQTATFAVTASGTSPLAYQWQKNNVNISGATSSSYTTPAETTADNGATFRVIVSNSSGSVTSASATLTVTSSGTGTGVQSPFTGLPMSIPGTITVSQYDNGGEGVAYHDNEAANLKSSTYRLGLGVDADGTEVGWVYAGEWIEYTVNVASDGAYTFTIPMSNAGTGGTFHLSFDGVNKTGAINVPATGSWATFQNATATAILSAGTQIMQIAWDSNGSTGAICGLHDISIAGGTGGGTVGNGTGLNGQYFDNADFTGANFTRTDATVNFDWGMGAPTSSMGVDYFSVRWTGQVQAQYSQAYTFYVTGDDGIRMWINGSLLIDKWLLQAPTEYAATMNLTAGTKYDIKLEYFENYGGAVAQLRWSSASTTKDIIPTSQLYPSGAPPVGQTPYSGTAMAIPGTITVSQYDNGGEGVAYHDNEAANLMASPFRTGVDANTSGEVGWVYAGEWIEYTVNVTAAGTYAMTIPMSNAGTGGTLHVNFDGVNKTGTINVPATGSWANVQNATASVSLSAGVQVMMISWDSNGSTGSICGLHDITISGGSGGTGLAIPGSIAASNYDNGGEGVAYHDVEAMNYMSSMFRPGQGVDANGGQGIGWIVAGEWVNYSVNVASAGNYVISMQVNAPAAGGTFHVNFGGVNKTGTLSVPNTGSWGVMQTLATTVNLSAGSQVMSIRFDTNNTAGGYVCGIGENIAFMPTGTG